MTSPSSASSDARDQEDVRTYPWALLEDAPRVSTVRGFVDLILRDTKAAGSFGNHRPWFRGVESVQFLATPAVLRRMYNEFEMVTSFRNRAPAYGDVPGRGEIDKWLFLMAHMGLPTRLLDWTESALVGLFFAVVKDSADDGLVWMLDPLKLNEITLGQAVFPNTWTEPGVHYFQFPFSKRPAAEFEHLPDGPMAVLPTFIHARMSAQRSCFTIHGLNNTSFEEQFADHAFVADGYLRKYIIVRSAFRKIRQELRLLGVSHATVFPDLDGLSREAKEDFLLEFKD